MTIQEAIKSGKPFRRKADGKQYPQDWYMYPPCKAKGWHIFPLRFSIDDKKVVRDILATDWEIKP